jgi:hypothetical protein
VQRFHGAQHKQPLPDLRHRTIQQDMIQAQRVGQGIPKTGSQFGIEQQRSVSVLQVEIDQCNSPPLAIGQMPCDIAGDRRRAHAAARADEGHDLAEFQGGLGSIAGSRSRRENPP